MNFFNKKHSGQAKIALSIGLLVLIFGTSGDSHNRHPASVLSKNSTEYNAVYTALLVGAATYPRANSPCLKCHADHQRQPVAHYPAAAGLCEVCHDAKPEHFADPKANKVGNKSVANTCLSCHGKMQEHSVIHPALRQDPEACITCHNPHGSEHPHSLRQNVQDTCLMCHDMMPDKSKSIHGVLKDQESCLNCHVAHSSENKKLLIVNPSPAFCLSCHNQEIDTQFSLNPRKLVNVEQQVKTMPFVHKPTLDTDDEKRGCLECHEAHSSKQEFLLRQNPANLCRTCHTAVKDPAQLVHGAMTDTRSCANCHNPHGSTQRRLLQYESRQLCFSCHDREIPLANRTIPNIKENLWPENYAHTQVGCTNCHQSPHEVETKKACTSCHQAEAQSALGSKHQCLQCHNPHRKVPEKLDPRWKSPWWSKCASCHTSIAKTTQERGPVHSNCNNCHQPHRFSVPKCMTCHTGMDEKGAHGVPEHLNNCKACHNPHTVASPTRANCVGCHVNKRNHQPQAFRCQACHPFQ
ncbi:cytochrome c3 family protein [Bdellovibrionota bacterium FG-1]